MLMTRHVVQQYDRPMTPVVVVQVKIIFHVYEEVKEGDVIVRAGGELPEHFTMVTDSKEQI